MAGLGHRGANEGRTDVFLNYKWNEAHEHLEAGTARQTGSSCIPDSEIFSLYFSAPKMSQQICDSHKL